MASRATCAIRRAPYLTAGARLAAARRLEGASSRKFPGILFREAELHVQASYDAVSAFSLVCTDPAVLLMDEAPLDGEGSQVSVVCAAYAMTALSKLFSLEAASRIFSGNS